MFIKGYMNKQAMLKCPTGLDLKWVEPIPANLRSLETFYASYNMSFGVIDVTSSPHLIPHANLHACKQSLGFCEWAFGNNATGGKWIHRVLIFQVKRW